MSDRNPTPQATEHDRLITRPNVPLPTPLDPAGPVARGEPPDPKPDPRKSQGGEAGERDAAQDLERTT